MTINESTEARVTETQLARPRRRNDARRVRDDAEPRLGLRDQMPKLGLREYWYPAIKAKSVGRRPVKTKLLGEELVFWRGKRGDVIAFSDACPHRNASMSQGRSHWKGTITCPYHGWTFDEEGTLVAALGDGQLCTATGQESARAFVYPTRNVKGLVFVWMGSGEPVPIEEDVPPELFDDNCFLQWTTDVWKANWRPATENFNDGHVFYVHRNSADLLFADEGGLSMLLHMGAERPPIRAVNDKAIVFENPRLFYDFFDRSDDKPKNAPGASQFQLTFPTTAPFIKWPKTMLRKHGSRLMGLLRGYLLPKASWNIDEPEWAGLHLPGIFRVDYQTHVYSRITVPVDENTSRIFYLNSSWPSSIGDRVRRRLVFQIWYRWKMHVWFSGQDKRVVQKLHYEMQNEKIVASDSFPMAWRKLVVEHARPPAGEGHMSDRLAGIAKAKDSIDA